MVHHRQCLSFGFEAGDDFARIHPGLDDFQSDFATNRLFLFGGIDDSHPPFTQLLTYFVRADSGMVGLGDLPGQTFISQALGVSADGNTVVGESRSFSGPEAFIWRSSTGMVGLGDLPGSPFASIARGVSASGNAVVGEGSVARLGAFNTVTRAFISRSPNFLALQNLGDLSGGPSDGDSLAYAVSADGSVVVGEGSSSFGREAFVWRAPTGMVGLGDLTDGSFFSQALGVSADGNTVVGRGTSASGGEAFRWTASGGMVVWAICLGEVFSVSARRLGRWRHCGRVKFRDFRE